MASSKNTRKESRELKQRRVRKKVLGTDAQPRLCVFRSLQFTYAQLISDQSGKVMASASTREVTAEGKSRKCVDSAKLLGAKMAELAKAASVEQVVFDRNGYIFHGRVKAVADGAREAGLKF